MNYQENRQISGHSKPVVEEKISINLSKFKKKRLLKKDTILNFNWEINGISTFKAKGYVKKDSLLIAYQCCDGEIIKQRIEISSTACHFGGNRKWLSCPVCGTKRMNLYFNENLFLCRDCNNLGYLSQKQNPSNRLLLKAQNLRRKISAGFTAIENKPLNMHWETFNNIKYKIYDFEIQGNNLFMQWANGRFAKQCNSN